MPSIYKKFQEFTSLDEVPDLLVECRQSPYRIKHTVNLTRSEVNDHMIPLIDYGKSIGATKLEIKNMVELGTGYADLVVLLQEPSDREDTYTIKELIEDEDYTYAGRVVQRSLDFTFRGERHLGNTIVMDVRPFRMNKIRGNELPSIKNQRDSEAYAAFMGALFLLRPKVILVCQCDKSGWKKGLGLPKELCSWVKDAGKHNSWIMPNGHETTVVYGVHPGFAYKQSNDFDHVAIEYLIDACFIGAAHALVGTDFNGEGLNKLRDYALKAINKGPARPVDPYEDRLLAIRIEFLSRMDPPRAAELAPKLLSAAQAATFISTLDLNPQKVEEEDDGVLTAFSNMTIGDAPEAIESRN